MMIIEANYQDATLFFSPPRAILTHGDGLGGKEENPLGGMIAQRWFGGQKEFLAVAWQLGFSYHKKDGRYLW